MAWDALRELSSGAAGGFGWIFLAPDGGRSGGEGALSRVPPGAPRTARGAWGGAGRVQVGPRPLALGRRGPQADFTPISGHVGSFFLGAVETHTDDGQPASEARTVMSAQWPRATGSHEADEEGLRGRAAPGRGTPRQ